MDTKRENALRDRNPHKANAKKDTVSVSRKKASVKELLGAMMWIFGVLCAFARWEMPGAEHLQITAVLLLLLGGLVLILEGME